MTTKKQRRANVAAKTAERREAERKLNLHLLQISQARRAAIKDDADRAERNSSIASAMRNKYDAAALESAFRGYE